MNQKSLVIAGIVTALTSCGAQDTAPPPASNSAAIATTPVPPYVGQPVPGLTPERFAPGLVSTEAIELNGVFSPAQREFYFTRVVNGVDTMYQIVFAGGTGGPPRELLLLPGGARAEAAD